MTVSVATFHVSWYNLAFFQTLKFHNSGTVHCNITKVLLINDYVITLHFGVKQLKICQAMSVYIHLCETM